MTLQSRLQSLAAIKLLGDYVKALDGTAKAELMDEVGGRMGATAATVDGEEIATVSIAQGRYPAGVVDGWYVRDEKAFLEWVRERRPEAVVETVRASDRKDLLARLPQWIIDNGGDVPEWAAEANRGDSYVMVNQSDKQKAAALQAWHSGRLARPEVAGYLEEES